MRLIGAIFLFLLRLIGLIFIAFGLIALVLLASVFAAGDGRAQQVLGQVWFQHDPFFFLFQSHSIQLAQVVIERKLGLISLWNPGVTTLLNWPSWQALLALAAGGLIIGGLLFVPRKRKAI